MALSLFSNLFGRKSAAATPFKDKMHFHSYLHLPGKPVWMPREYGRFADEAYIRNVIAHRSISMIAEGAASVDFQLFHHNDTHKTEVKHHSLLTLLSRPNPCTGGAGFFQGVFSSYLISGNSFILAVGAHDEVPTELHMLRPDRISVIAGKSCLPQGYRYTIGDSYKDYVVDRVTGRSRVLHLKSFHPLNDWYGLSPVEAAAYSIDQHNQAGQWNQSLLQNGARPTGALVVKGESGNDRLDQEQYGRLKQQLDKNYSGAANAGRPLLLEGGLEWREMSLSPKDMDFIEAKHSAARDIALAFGVPPQLLGIPGDNRYSNFAEARLSLWEQTILPLLDKFVDELNNWLVPMFDERLILSYNTDSINALAPRREKVWARLRDASFMTDDEKRIAVGLSPSRKD